MCMIKVLDYSEFWSSTGGGVRRYYLEKIRYYKNNSDIKLTVIMPDKENSIEKISEQTQIIKVKASSVPFINNYRYFLNIFKIIRIIKEQQPDIIELGSPFAAPLLFRIAVKVTKVKPTFVSFWHADFPVTYFTRILERFLGAKISHYIEKLVWKVTKAYFGFINTIFVSSQFIEDRMHENGLTQTTYLSLGVDTEMFHPSKKDISIGKNIPDFGKRPMLFFPHRLSQEKGVSNLLKAYRTLSETSIELPILMFIGLGPAMHLVKKATKQFKHIHHMDFLKSKTEIAKWYACSDLLIALSSWETFGLSILEAMSSGVPVLSVADGAALEHIQNSQAGMSIFANHPESICNGILWFLQDQSIEEKKLNARKYAEKFTWKICFKKQIECYKQIFNAAQKK